MDKTYIKPLFSVDITSDKKNEVPTGAEFIVRSLSKEEMQEVENRRDDFDKSTEKSSLPSWFFIVEYAFVVIAFIIYAVSGRIGFEKVMKDSPILMISGTACGIIWIVLHTFSNYKKNMKRKENEERIFEINEERDFILYEKLGVPKNAKNADVLIFSYTVENGTVTPYFPDFLSTPYFNSAVKIYESGDAVNIADGEGNLYSFKKNEFKSISACDEQISVNEWNKKDSPSSEKFKSHVTSVDKDKITVKSYYILHIERGGENFGIRFPSYEIELFEGITKLKAEK